MNSRTLLIALLATLTSVFSTIASDHLDAPLVFTDGRLDVNDSYIFQSPMDSSKTVMIMTVNPVAGVMSPITFNPAANYEFNIDSDGDAIPDLSYVVNFGAPGKNGVTQRFTLRRNGALIARGVTGGKNVPIRTKEKGLIRCDLFDDPFFFDLVGFNNGFAFTGDDFFAGLNTSAIVIEIPTTNISKANANVSLSARTTINGKQFDRVGRPAINTALIPAGLKDAFNAGLPVDDFEDFGPVVQASIEGLNGGDTVTAKNLTAILLPDVLTVDLSNPAGFLNGRGLADDVIDAELNLLSNGAVTGDMVDNNDVPFLEVFPYLAEAHN